MTHSGQLKTLLSVLLAVVLVLGMFISSITLPSMMATVAILPEELRCDCPSCPSAAVVNVDQELNERTVVRRVASDEKDTIGEKADMQTTTTLNQEKDKDESLYGTLCNATILGEKETWNQHKKVISFSIFSVHEGEELPSWVQKGIGFQVSTAKKYYPDWVVRFYTVGLSPALEQELIQHDNVELVRCIRLSSTSRMMLHRFLVVDDPAVRYSIVRDVDSRFSLRELMAVNEWISSPHLFHSMRDHRQHTVPVMGGGFGMKRGLLETSSIPTMSALVEQALEQFPHKIRGCCGEDQNFLSTFVWPKVRDLSLDHDSTPGSCRRYGGKECRDFPLGPRNQDQLYFMLAPFKEPDSFSDATGHTCTLDCKIDRVSS